LRRPELIAGGLEPFEGSRVSQMSRLGRLCRPELIAGGLEPFEGSRVSQMSRLGRSELDGAATQYLDPVATHPRERARLAPRGGPAVEDPAASLEDLVDRLGGRDRGLPGPVGAGGGDR